MENLEKTCKDCNNTYNIDNFNTHNHKRNSKKKGEYILTTTSSYCKICDKVRNREIQLKYKEKYKEAYKVKNLSEEKLNKRRAKDREKYRENPAKNLISKAKQRSKKKGLDFNIEESDIIIPKVCPLLNIPIIQGVKGDYGNTPSLDRIDPTKGYTKDNIWVISMKANTMKSNASRGELLEFARMIFKHFKDDIV